MTEGAASGESLATAGVAAGVPGAPADAAKPHAHLGRRNDRLLLAGVASYAVLLSVLMISRGISVTPDVVVVSFGLAAMLLGRGRLFLRDYEVWINIGVHDFEKKGEQRVRINVDLYVPLALSTPTRDQLAEVLDYDFIRRTIAARVARGHIHLQETLADDVLRLMLAHPDVRAARVATEKPDVYPDCDAVGCEVFGMKAPA